ncbi:MAG: right-handed parallel beta-helix repeat-containing protein [Candidatus Zixiibacteriota bacterium]
MYKISLTFIIILILAVSVSAKKIYVPADSATIQAGVNGADEYFDTVYVAAGTYADPGNRDIIIDNKTIMVWSEDGALSTIIDCQGSESVSHIAFRLTGENNHTNIDGFTITGAYSGVDSGAIHIYKASPLVSHCIITNNESNGIYAYLSDSLKIVGCEVSHNANHGVYSQAGRLNVDSCQVAYNTDDGISFYWSGNISVKQSLMNGNGNAGIYYLAMGEIIITNNTIYDNLIGLQIIASYPKGETDKAPSAVANNLFAYNHHYGIYGDPTFDLFDALCNNSFGNIYGDYYNCQPYFGPDDENGNISANPLFCDTAGGDFRVADISLCLPANNGCGQLIGKFGEGCTKTIKTWYVNAEGTGDAPTIQGVVDLAETGDTIIAAAGTYTGDGNRDINLSSKGLYIISEAGPDLTIIDCEGADGDFHYAFMSDYGYFDKTELNGFTITGGWPQYYQGTLYLRSGASIFNCKIINNHGVGMELASSNSTSVVADCIVSNNTGFGIYTWGNTSVKNCLMARNGAGFIHDDNADIDISGCTAVLNENEGINLSGWPPKSEIDADLYEFFNSAPDKNAESKGYSTISNCVAAFNGGVGIGKVFYLGIVQTSCNNAYGNEPYNWMVYDSALNGNFSENPQFCDTTNDDYTIYSTSPCAAANNSCLELIGTYDVGCTAGNRAWYVYFDGSGDASTIQGAVDLAVSGDTIFVGPGVFTGDGNRDIDFGLKGLHLISLDGSGSTIIDCQASESDLHYAIKINSGAEHSSEIDGFIITGAWSAWPYAAVYCASNLPVTISNCNIYGNHDDGIFCTWGTGILIDNCMITDNGGDGIVTISNTTMTNTLLARNGGYGFNHINHADINITNCTAVLNGGTGIALEGDPPKDIDGTDKGVEGTGVISNCISAFNGGDGFIRVFWLGVLTFECNNSFGNGGDDWGYWQIEPGNPEGNISFDPLFCDTVLNNFQIAEASPCAPLNNSCGELIGKFTVGCDGFLCGDNNGSGNINLLDITYLIACLYRGGPCPELEIADVNSSGNLNILDITYFIAYLYKGGEPLNCVMPVK